MNYHHRTLCISLLFILCMALLTGCGSAEAVSPFSGLSWSASPDDVIDTEGSDYGTYDSVYEGTTYTFAKTYKDTAGTVKYMFDDSEALMSIAWSCTSDDAEALQALYSEIHAELVGKYGESGYNTNKSTNYGDVWHLEDGDIVLSVMTTASQNALQYSYLHPDVSYQGKDE